MKSNLTSGVSLAITITFLVTTFGYSQQTVAIGDSNPKTNAILYLKGNGSQGLIIPIVTALGTFGEAGMVVYNSTDKRLHYHDGNSWSVVGGNSVAVDGVVGNEVTGIGATGGLSLTGSGTTASPLTISMVAGTSNGQVLKWNSGTSKWELGVDNSGTVALNSAQILVGNAANTPTAVTVSGDATLSNTGVLTIGTGTVNSAKILDGAITNTDVAAGAAIAPSKIGQAGAANQQVLKWNGTAWAPAADNAGTVALNSTQILVGDATNTPAAVSVSGDATLSNTGALTLGTGSVNSTKILDGTIANADIAAGAAIAPSKIGQAGAANQQVLKWNGTAWAPAADNAGTVALNSTQILVGDATNTPAAVNLSGDATLSNTGALTLGTGSVNSTKILDGTIANADIAAGAAIAPSKIGQAGAASQQVLKWNGTAWAPAADNSGVSTTLNDGQILVGNAANTATAVTPSGDASVANTGAITIANNAINSAKISDGTVASIDIANNTILNADINTGAAIDGSKINPNFVGQDITTTGTTTSGNLVATGTVTFNALTGSGTRLVTTNDAGVIGAQAVPLFSTANYLPKGDGVGLIASGIYDNGTNIGIGTTSPLYPLDIHKSLSGGADAHLRVYNPNAVNGQKSGIRLGVSDFWAVHLNTEYNGNWLELTDISGTVVHRWTADSYYPGNGTSYIRGTGNNMAYMAGFNGFGTTSPDRKVDIEDTFYKLLRLTSSSSGAGIELVSTSSDDWLVTTWANSFYLSNSTDNFTSQTDQYIFTTGAFRPVSDNTKTLGSSGARWIAVYSVNGTIQTSDLRLKNNISNLNYGLDEVLKLRPVSYSWKSDPSSKKIGLIAQEVQKIVPEVVTDGDYLGMNYGELVPVLINAIQEQQKTIQALEEKLKVLESTKSTELETLKAEVSEIKKALGLEANAGK
jgi:hypothetical protein